MSGDRIDHAAEARELLAWLKPSRDTGPAQGRGYWSMFEAAQVDALRGIGHALLAIHEALAPPPVGTGPIYRTDMAALARVGRMYLDALDDDPENEALTLVEAFSVTEVREAVERFEQATDA